MSTQAQPVRSAHYRWRYALIALTYSLANAVFGVFWAGGGRGFPAGPGDDPVARASVLAAAPQATLGWVMAAAGAGWALVAFAMLRVPRARGMRTAVASAAWVACIVLLVVVPDARVLAAVAYAPLFVIGAPFGWPPVSYGVLVPWPVVYQALCMGAGVVWGAAAVELGRATAAPCTCCGRLRSPRLLPHRWHIGVVRASVPVAVAIPLSYATTRWMWAAGYPLGITETFFREGQSSGLWLAGAGLASVAAGGSLLTVGLVQPWGERIPGWVPWLAGRSVPPLVPVTIALPVAALITSAGIGAVRAHLAHGFPADGWGTTAPGLLWPLWGLSLAVAALGYLERRRGSCTVCMHGDLPQR